MATAFIGLGSNLGDRLGYVRQALEYLEASSTIRVREVSSFYEAEPVEYPDQGWFVNAVVRVETPLDPLDLLNELQSIEKRLQRQRTIRWGPRTIDLDILLYDDDLVAEARLQIPHIRMHDRAFVLVPLSEIAPEIIHPILNQTIRDLLEELPRRTQVNLLDDQANA
ncbi:MAG TPA: 2-amino-4-hydroxy-6-hydroxymethyldihydropteridine diphosphokinase [Cyanobacteria bacterium UBA8530]|nr:2-amino-4-hydroxy-6-hydroxymethyldihydropteridine diphosphokinase [Cyanobacteria bacterium UBA8530]